MPESDDDLDARIDQLALDIEQSIAEGEETLEELPDFEYGAYLREQGERAQEFFADMEGVVVRGQRGQ